MCELVGSGVFRFAMYAFLVLAVYLFIYAASIHFTSSPNTESRTKVRNILILVGIALIIMLVMFVLRLTCPTGMTTQTGQTTTSAPGQTT